MACLRHPDAPNYVNGRPRPACAQCVRNWRKAGYDRHGPNMKDRWSTTRRSAERRAIPFELTYEEYAAVVSHPCVYQISAHMANKIGVDRKDNSIGYTRENSLPCCARHNEIKSDVFSYDQMIDIVHRHRIECGDSRAGRKKTPRL